MIGFIIIALFYGVPLYIIIRFSFFSDDKTQEPEPSKIVIHNYRLKPRHYYYNDSNLVDIGQDHESRKKMAWLMKEWKLK